MGRPKESLSYRGTIEPVRVYEILERITDCTYFSIRPDQETWLAFQGGRSIVDSIPDAGPMGALCSAFEAHPGASWLLVPVDMPLLESRDLELLITSRAKERDIVAYSDGARSFEPMPAIYESTLDATAHQLMQGGRRAIRGLGDWTEPIILDPGDKKRLMNINTFQQRAQTMEVLRG
jgi:molybdopterin-guanine dinucleotide biosynthesis protein A